MRVLGVGRRGGAAEDPWASVNQLQCPKCSGGRCLFCVLTVELKIMPPVLYSKLERLYGIYALIFFNWIVFLIQYIEVTQVTFTYTHFPTYKMILGSPHAHFFLLIFFCVCGGSTWRPYTC